MKKNTPLIKRSVQCLFAFVLFTMLIGTVAAQQTQQLPIDFFISKVPDLQSNGRPTAQGWFDPANGNLIVIDAFNKRNSILGLGLPTVMEGKVTIQPLKDGMLRYIVDGQTRNALCFGVSQGGQGPMAFGYSQDEVLAGAKAALGSVNYRYVYAPQPAGTFNYNGPQEFVGASVQCDGPLRAGSGFAEGTPGFAQTRQTGLDPRAGKGCPPGIDGDCYPTEKVQFKPREE